MNRRSFLKRMAALGLVMAAPSTLEILDRMAYVPKTSVVVDGLNGPMYSFTFSWFDCRTGLETPMLISETAADSFSRPLGAQAMTPAALRAP